MPRLLRYTTALLIFGITAALLGKLLVTRVHLSRHEPILSFAGAYGRGVYERGWPWVFRVTEEPAGGPDWSPDQSVEVIRFSVPSLILDLLLAAVILALVFVWWRWIEQQSWRQFSLRTLLMILTLFAVICAWVFREKRLSVAEANVRSKSSFGLGLAYCGPEWLRRILPEEKLGWCYHIVDAAIVSRPSPRGFLERSFVNSNARVSREDLNSFTTMLKDHPFLRSIDLCGGLPTDFDRFGEWRNVDVLSIQRADLDQHFFDQLTMLRLRSFCIFNGCTGLTASNLGQVAAIRSLEEIRLDDVPVDDRGIAALAALPKLRILSIGDTDHVCEVTNASVVTLNSFPALETLWIAGTKVNDEGVLRIAENPHIVELRTPVSISQGTIVELKKKIRRVITNGDFR